MPDWFWPLAIGGVVTGLIGVVWGMLQHRIERSEAAFEKAITSIRTELDRAECRWEQWARDKERFDHEFRHDEYAKAITDINAKLWPMATVVDALSKRVDRIEFKNNGNGK